MRIIQKPNFFSQILSNNLNLLFNPFKGTCLLPDSFKICSSWTVVFCLHTSDNSQFQFTPNSFPSEKFHSFTRCLFRTRLRTFIRQVLRLSDKSGSRYCITGSLLSSHTAPVTHSCRKGAFLFSFFSCLLRCLSCISCKPVRTVPGQSLQPLHPLQLQLCAMWEVRYPLRPLRKPSC